jgi:hypothetical protein
MITAHNMAWHCRSEITQLQEEVDTGADSVRQIKFHFSQMA